MGFGRSKVLPLAICQLRANICYIPSTLASNLPGEIQEWCHPIGCSRTLRGPRGRNCPGGGSRGGAPIRPDRGGAGLPVSATTSRPRARVRWWPSACAGGRVDAYAQACSHRRLHTCGCVGASAGAVAGVRIRVRGGASSSTRWGYPRRRRVVPALSRFGYHGDKEIVVNWSRGDEGVCTS